VGCVKKLHITRKRYNSRHDLVDDTKTFVINVKPGWKKGTKVTFINEGEEGPNIIPADLIFVIQEKATAEDTPPGYEREGSNLIYTHKLSLSDALTDCSLQIPTLDGRFLSIACPEVVSPFYEKRVPGEGMPLVKSPGTKGDLIIRFHILFPKYLNGEKRLKIRELLANEELQT
jgi:DnaJ-class molecular chaperone